jgi:hypothetical protein
VEADSKGDTFYAAIASARLADGNWPTGQENHVERLRDTVATISRKGSHDPTRRQAMSAKRDDASNRQRLFCFGNCNQFESG